MEHHSNIVPWQQLAERTGCRVRFLPITDDGCLQLDALADFLTERTRLVAVTAVSNVLGTVNPVKQVIDAAHAAGALVLVDAAQSVPHAVTDVRSWDADFVAFSGHKMLGPSGVGVLYGRETVLDGMPPFLGGGSMIRRVTRRDLSRRNCLPNSRRGLLPSCPHLGLASAIEYLEGVGLAKIEQYESILASARHEILHRRRRCQIAWPVARQKGGHCQFRRGTEFMPTTSPRSWISMEWPFGRGIIVRCRFTSDSV